MAVQRSEDFSSLEIYRSVTAGADHFLDHVSHAGARIFGFVVNSVVAEPQLQETEDGGEEAIVAINGIWTPRLDVYRPANLRLALLSRSAPTRMNYANNFRRAVGRLTDTADQEAYKPIKRPMEDEDDLETQPRQKSLASKLDQIGLKYDVVDQQHLELPFHALDLPVDPPHEHLGQEVSLLPDPKKRETMMLVEQSVMCAHYLGMLSTKAAYPTSPTSINLPFACLPVDAAPDETSEFLEAVEQLLPLRLALGGFKDDMSSSSW